MDFAVRVNIFQIFICFGATQQRQPLISHLSVLLKNKHTLCPSSKSVSLVCEYINSKKHNTTFGTYLPKNQWFSFSLCQMYLPNTLLHTENYDHQPRTQISKHTSQDIRSVTKRHLPSINAPK